MKVLLKQMNSNSKKCSKCSIVKLVKNFWKNKSNNNGLESQCKECRQNFKQTWEGKTTNLLTNAQQRAKKRGTSCTLTLQIVRELVKNTTNCNTCKKSIRFNKKIQNKDSITLDEIHHGEGYTPENTWILCHRCNAHKLDFSLQECKLFAINFEEALKKRGKNYESL